MKWLLLVIEAHRLRLSMVPTHSMEVSVERHTVKDFFASSLDQTEFVTNKNEKNQVPSLNTASFYESSPDISRPRDIQKGICPENKLWCLSKALELSSSWIMYSPQKETLGFGYLLFSLWNQLFVPTFKASISCQNCLWLIGESLGTTIVNPLRNIFNDEV